MKSFLTLLGSSITAAVLGAGIITPGAGNIAGGSGTGGVSSNYVYTMIQNYAPTNGGITASQAGTQILSTNNNDVYPKINAVSNNVTAVSNQLVLASSTNSGFLDTNNFNKLLPYPHSYDSFMPVPPDEFNTYYAMSTSDATQTTHSNMMALLSTNGWIAMSRKYHIQSYYDIDDGWSSNRVNGVDVYDTNRFPSGMSNLAQGAKSYGFKGLGLYGIGSNEQGKGFTNAYGNATNLLAYGIEMMKLEVSGVENTDLQVLYPFVRVFQTNGHPIFLEGGVGFYGNGYYPWLRGLMQSPRMLVNGDVTDYAHLMANLDGIRIVSPYTAGPGYFPSAEYASLNLTGDELTTHFAAMAMIPSPWAISMPTNTLGNVAKFGLATNEDVYVLNKDPLARPGFMLYSNQLVDVFERSCVSNSAVVQFENRLSVSTNYTFYFTNLVQTPYFKTNVSYFVRNLWAQTNFPYATNSITISINSHASALIKFLPIGWVNSANSAVSAGTNIVVTTSTNGSSGQVTYTPSVSDPLSLNSINTVSLTATNLFVSTNDMSGVTVIDLATGSETTLAASGNVSISGFQNAKSGVSNKKIVNILPNGADRSIAVPASWQTNYLCTGIVTNGQVGHFLFWMQLGAFTNWMQLNAR